MTRSQMAFIRGVLEKDHETFVRRIRAHFIPAPETRTIEREVDVDVVIDRSVEFIPDDTSNRPRKYPPDAFPNEYFRHVRSE